MLKGWQCDSEFCVLVLFGLYRDGTVVVLHNFVTEVESDTSGLGGRLRGEEWVENLTDDSLLNAYAVVSEFQDDLFVGNSDIETDVRLVGTLLLRCFFDDGIDGIAQHIGVKVGLSAFQPFSLLAFFV